MCACGCSHVYPQLCACAHTCVYPHVCSHMRVHVYIHDCLPVCPHVCISTHVCSHVYVSTRVSTIVFACVSTHVCVYPRMYVSTCIHACVHVCSHVSTCVPTLVCVRVYTCVYPHLCVHMPIHVRVYPHLCVRMYIHVCIHACVCMCPHMCAGAMKNQQLWGHMGLWLTGNSCCPGTWERWGLDLSAQGWAAHHLMGLSAEPGGPSCGGTGRVAVAALLPPSSGRTPSTFQLLLTGFLTKNIRSMGKRHSAPQGEGGAWGKQPPAGPGTLFKPGGKREPGGPGGCVLAPGGAVSGDKPTHLPPLPHRGAQ